MEALNGSADRQLAYTTVMTILVRLHEKGLVTRQKDGRQYRYTAAVDEASLGAQVRARADLRDRGGIAPRSIRRRGRPSRGAARRARPRPRG